MQYSQVAPCLSHLPQPFKVSRARSRFIRHQYIMIPSASPPCTMAQNRGLATWMPPNCVSLKISGITVMQQCPLDQESLSVKGLDFLDCELVFEDVRFPGMALSSYKKCWYNCSNFPQFVPDKKLSSKLSWLLFFCSKMLVNTISLINLRFCFITEN